MNSNAIIINNNNSNDNNDNCNSSMTIAQLCKIRDKKTTKKTDYKSLFMDEVCIGSIDDIASRSEDDADKSDRSTINNSPINIKGSKDKMNAMKPSKIKSKSNNDSSRCKNFKKWWRNDEICKFYKAMMVCGINFSLIEAYMGYTRTQKQLKLRYTAECKMRPQLIDQVTTFKGSIDDDAFNAIMSSIAENVKE